MRQGGGQRVGGAIGAAGLLALVLPGTAAAATPAGLRIANTAQLATAGATVPSNTVELVVAELLDVTVAADTPARAPSTGGVEPVGFTVRNTGNGEETFTLVAAADAAGGSIDAIVADVDGDGAYDPAVDTAIATSLTLAAGAARHVFVVARVPAGRVAIALTAIADTGHGPAGTIVAGAGTGGGDAVVGATGGSARAATTIDADAAGAGQGPSLVKSQSVRAPDGSARAVTGAVITYRLEARFPAATRAVAISDAVPAGTRFVAGSIALDGAVLSDADDGDAARFDGAAVRVALGDVAAAGRRTVTFQTIIQ